MIAGTRMRKRRDSAAACCEPPEASCFSATLDHLMLVAWLPGPIDVHVSNGTDWVTPVSILLAGLIATWLSWITHRRTLRHERLLREREATRRALDVVVDEINRTADVLQRAGEASGDLERALPDHPRPRFFRPRQFDERLRRSSRELKESHARLMGAAFRLHLRFPDDHPIIGAFARWRDGIGRLADEYQVLLDSPAQGLWEALRMAHETHAVLGRQLFEFLTVAREWSTAPEREANKL